ncbi:MAG: hypothetical protein QOH06_3239 [Acidobacteriota bacterium]|jgi:uncharacterized protein with HEPN domain|nr:hypothetical protein [Acidobacteriota bacterium]
MRDSRERVLDILEAIERIEKYAANGRESFDRDELVQVWILHHLQVLGEAVNALRPFLHEEFPEVPWAQIVGMRNVLVHQYFEIDTDIVWTVVERELPRLKAQFHSMLAAWEPKDG